MFEKNVKNKYMEKIKETKLNSGVIREKIFYFILKRKKMSRHWKNVKC